MDTIIRQGIRMSASLDPASQKEMHATLERIFSEAGNKINFNTPQNRKELESLVAVFRDMFASVGNTKFDFSKMMTLSGDEMFAEMKVAAKEFEGVWNQIVTRMGNNSLSSVFMKNQSELSVALERMTNAQGKLNSSMVKNMQKAFQPVKSKDINYLLEEAEGSKGSFMRGETWEERTTAALRYLNVYQRIMSLTDRGTDLSGMDAAMKKTFSELANLGPYTVEQIESVKPQLQASLQNLFNLSTGRPLIGLTDGGAIDVNVAPKVIKTLDVYDVLGGKTELGVNVTPEIDPGFQEKLSKLWELAQAKNAAKGTPGFKTASGQYIEQFNEILNMFPEDKLNAVESRLERFANLKNLTDATLGTAWRDFYGLGKTGGVFGFGGGSGTGDGTGGGTGGSGSGTGDASSEELANLQKQLANKETELARVREENAAKQASLDSTNNQLNESQSARLAAEQREAALTEEIATLRQQIANMSAGGLGGGGIVGNNALQQLQKDAEVASKAFEDAHNKLSSIIQAEEELDWRLTSRGLVDYAEKYQNAATMKKQEVDNLRRSFTKKSDHKSNVDAIEGVIQNLINNEALGVNGVFTSPKDLSEFTDYKFAVDTGATNKVLNGLLNSLVNKLQREVLDTMDTYKSWGDIQSRDNPDADSLIEQRRRLAKEHSAAEKAYNEAANAQSEAYEKLNAAQDRSGGLDGSAGATQEEIENANKLAEVIQKVETAYKELDALSDDPWNIKNEEEVNRILQERLAIIQRVGEENLRAHNPEAYAGVEYMNNEYASRITGFKELQDDAIYTKLDDKFGYDNEIIASAQELELLLAKRRELMQGIHFDAEQEYLEQEEINSAIERRIALMKQLEPLVANGSITQSQLEEMVMERGTLDERRSMLEGVQQNLFNAEPEDLSEAQYVLDQYEKIMVETASGKKLTLGPEMSEADWKAFERMDVEKAKSIEFVRKEIQTHNENTGAINAETQALERANARRAELANQLGGIGSDASDVSTLEQNLAKRKEIFGLLQQEDLLTDEIRASYDAVNAEIQEKIALLKKAQGSAEGAVIGGTGTGGAETVPAQTIPDGATSAEAAELEAIRAKVAEVTAAVNTKTQAFFDEQSAVKRVAKSEVHALSTVEKKITEIKVALGNLRTGTYTIDVSIGGNKAISAESKSLGTLQKKITDITSAVDTKTQAFFAEQTAVKRIAQSEVHALGTVQKKITEIRTALNNLGANSGLTQVQTQAEAAQSQLSEIASTIHHVKSASAGMQSVVKPTDNNTVEDQAQTINTLLGLYQDLGYQQEALYQAEEKKDQLERYSASQRIKELHELIAMGERSINVTEILREQFNAARASGADSFNNMPPKEIVTPDLDEVLDRKKDVQFSSLSLMYEKLSAAGKLTEDLKVKWASLWDSLDKVDGAESLSIWRDELRIVSNSMQEIIIKNNLMTQEGKTSFQQLIGVTKLYNQMAIGAQKAPTQELKSFYTNEANQLLVEQQRLLSGITLTEAQQAKFDELEAARKREINKIIAQMSGAERTRQETQAAKEQADIIQKLIKLYQEYGALRERASAISGSALAAQVSFEANDKLSEIQTLRQSLTKIDPAVQKSFDEAFDRGKAIESKKQYEATAKAIDAEELARVKQLGLEYEKLGRLQAQEAMTVGDNEQQWLREQIRLQEENINLKQQGLNVDLALYNTKRLEAYSQELDKINQKIARDADKAEQKSFKQQIKDAQKEAGLTKSGNVVNNANETLMSAMRLGAISPEQQNNLQAYNSKIETLKSTIASFPRDGIVKDEQKRQLISQRLEVENYTKQIQELIANYERLSGENSMALQEGTFISAGASSETIKTALTDAVMLETRGRASIKGFNYDTNELSYTLKNAKGEFTSYTAAVRQSDGAMRSVRGSSKKMLGVFESIGKKMKEFSYYFTGSMMIYRVIAWVREGITAVKDIDTALTELKKVTDATEESYDKFLDTAAKTADKVGSTIKEIVSSTADWARLGYSMKEAAELAESTQILMNVSEFTDVSQATDTLISAVQAFGYTAETSMEVVDLMNTIGKIIAYR